MASSNLTTRLTKELKRSPKKTAMLALGLVVALWFWAPLAWKWLAPQSSDAAASTAPAQPLASGAQPMVAPSYSSASTPAVAAMNWREMASLLENDPLLASARMHEKLADPFVRSTETAEVKTNTEEAIDPATTPIEPPKPTPEQLGLQVASTITGGRHAVATINGRSCRVGDVIVVPGGGADFEFTVIDIGAGEVTLEGNGQKQVLKARRRDSTMKLSQTATGDSEKPQTSGQRVVIGVQLGE